jgi:predicted DsbA family dithiol-disulfide isomerase
MRMALLNEHVTAQVVEATEFPDLVRRFRVTGVPKTVVNGQVEILGALPEEAFVAQALAALPGRRPGTEDATLRTES